MDVKSRTTKFWKGGNMRRSTFREMLLSIVATTISIVLTFGTAAVLEHNQRQENRRQIAFMVIGDIYDFATTMEYTDSAILSVWKNDLLELQAMPRDSIIRLTPEEQQKYWNAFMQGAMLPHDKTAERLFTSDFSNWRDVGHFRFLKAIGHYYSDIADIEKNFNVQIERKDKLFQLFKANNIDELPDSLQLVTFMELKDVQYFIVDFTGSFQQYFKGQNESMYRAVKDCMEMMDISPKEMEEFINKQ